MQKNKLLLIFILLLIFANWLIPGVRVANDFPWVARSAIAKGLQIPQTWTTRGGNGLGEYAVGTLWSWPLDLIYGVGAKAGLDFAALERLLGVYLALIIGWVGMSKLKNYVASLVYLTSSYFILLVDGGQLSIALAYATFPWCIYLYLSDALLPFVVSVTVLSIFDLRMVYLLCIVVVLNFISQVVFKRELQIRKHLIFGLVTGLFLVGVHSYWLVPTLFARPPSLPFAYTQSAQLIFLDFTKLANGLLMQQPHWFLNVFGKVANLRLEFLLYPTLAFAVLFVKPKKYSVFLWSAVALVGIFLSKGGYVWAFTHIPGFSLFRDSTKFFFLICLAYAFLIGELVERFPKLLYVVVLTVILVNFPVLSGKMTGTFSNPRFLQDYSNLQNYLSQDDKFGRILWVPTRPPLGFTDPNHPVIEGIQIYNNRPFVSRVFGTYEIMNFLRDSPDTTNLLAEAGINYVVLPPLDPYRDELKPDNLVYHQLFEQQLEQAPWAGESRSFGEVKLIQTKKTISLFSLPEKAVLVVGSDNVYPKAEDAALVFAEQQQNSISNLSDLNNFEILLNTKTKLDLALALSSRSFIFPSTWLPSSPQEGGWWKRYSGEFLSFRDFLRQKYGIENQDFDFAGGVAIAEGEKILSVPTHSEAGGLLFARVLTSSAGGTLTFWQGDQKIGTVATAIINPREIKFDVGGNRQVFSNSNYSWAKVGELLDKSLVTVKSSGELNSINALTVLSLNDFNHLMTLPHNNPTVSPTVKPNLEYKEISPTHYSITITGLDHPRLLVFSQSFDPLWQLSGQSPTKTYGFLNGYWITQDGQYQLEFEPQKFVLPGLVVSGVTLTILLGLFILKHKK